jgi:PKD repeat protein
MTDFTEATAPVYRAKSFKGYFVPKVENADIDLTFTTTGDGGFTRLLIKDDNDDVISNTSLMFGRNPETIIIQPNGSGNNNDTYISQNASGTNYGNATTFSVGHTQEENGKEINDYDIRAILKFDLTSVINEYIAGATLTLTGISDQNDQTLTLYRCGQDNWTELGATWSTYNGTNIWSAGDPTTPSTSINYTGGDATFDITELVIDAIENRAGILNMVLDGGTDLGYVLATFASFENVTAASRPKITIHTATALTITINDSNMSNPTPWYVEATSSRNAYVDVKVEGPGDATPILFGADKTATYNLKYWAIGTPVAQFTADDTTGEAPFTIQFTDQSTNTPNTWSWNFGDGNTSTEQNPTHTYTTSGTYTVTLTASSPAGSDAEVKNNYITITDILDDAPLWGLDYDPMAELMNRGEGNKSAAAAGLPGVLARNPMLVKAPDGSILFLCHSASGFTNGGHGLTFAIRSKRSTDNGLTWSDPVDIYNYANFSPDNSWFQLSGVVVDEVGIDDDTPAIIVFGTKGDTTDQHHKNYIFRSEDNGQTWSAATEITSQIVNPSAVTRNVAGVDTGANTVTTSVIHSYSVGQAITFATSGTLPSPLVAGRTYFARVSNSVIFFVHETYDDAQAATNTIDLTTSGTGFHTVTTQWSWNIPTGIGIQLSDNSSNPGRLIVPCNHRSRGFNSNDTYYGPVTGHFIYSDDGGLNWDVLGVLPTEYTEEMTVIETSTADKLYANIKAGTGSYRNYATSINGGVNWSLANTDIDLEQLPAPGQLVRLNNDTIVLATTRDTSGLVHKAISLYTSADDGDTWVFVKTLFYRYAENCSILPLNDNHILLAFENSSSDLTNATPASNFEDTAYQSISLVKINKVWLDDTIPNVAEWFFNEETTGVRVNPYSPAIIDYGGRLNAKAVSYSATNTGLYTSNGIELTDANNDAIILSPDLGELFTNDPFTIEVEATIGVGENGMLISNRTSMGISLEVITNVLVATLSDGTFTTTSTGVTAVNDGVRRCYAVVRDKDVTNRLYIYIDGVLESGHAADTCGNVNMNNSLYLGQNYLFGSQLVATFHSCRITNDAVAALDLQVAPRTKITPHEFRNYTAPTPPAFVPTDLTDLETWLFASVDGGEAAFADSQWSLSYKLPYYSGAKISSYRDKSPNKYFFNILETAWIEYVTDSTIGPHYRPYFESTTPSNANLILKRDAASVYDFIPGGTFAIGMAVKINSMVGGGSQIVLDTQDASSANAGFHIYIDSNRKPGINVGGGAGAFNYAFTAATAMTVGDWYFLLYVGRGVGTGLDLYIGHYTNGVYDPDSPTIPTLTKYTSTNMTAPALTTNANPLTIGAKASDGTAPSDIYLKNIVIYSEVTQFATGNTINQDQLCAFNLYA